MLQTKYKSIPGTRDNATILFFPKPWLRSHYCCKACVGRSVNITLPSSL